MFLNRSEVSSNYQECMNIVSNYYTNLDSRPLYLVYLVCACAYITPKKGVIRVFVDTVSKIDTYTEVVSVYMEVLSMIVYKEN